MKVSIIRRNGDTEFREGHVGSSLYVGVRLGLVSFETREEIKKLITPEGQKWLARLAYAMKE